MISVCADGNLGFYFFQRDGDEGVLQKKNETGRFIGLLLVRQAKPKLLVPIAIGVV